VPRVKIFFDGGCRPNPGAIEIAVVAAGQTSILRDLGTGTSTDAEWLALIHAMTIARSLDTTDVVLLGDSADVVAKANGKVKCRGAEVEHLERFRALAPAASPRLRYIKRAQNLAGIALSRLHAR
jgi:ribonuclease HI